MAGPTVRAVLALMFAALVVSLGLAVWRRPTWPRVLLGSAGATLIYFAVVYAWNFPWYLTTPLGLSASFVDRRAGRALFWLAAALGALWSCLNYAVLVPVPNQGG
jgi:hypothetical protein